MGECWTCTSEARNIETLDGFRSITSETAQGAFGTKRVFLPALLSPTMPFHKVDTDELSINAIRALAADIVNKANSGHPGKRSVLACAHGLIYIDVC